MITRKITLTLVAFILFMPVFTYAGDDPSGKPFQALQEQIDQLQTQIQDLQTQLQNIQLTPGPPGQTGPAGPAGVANGITRAVHGAIDRNGAILNGSGFHISSQFCHLPDYGCATGIEFDTPFSTTPTCTISALDIDVTNDDVVMSLNSVTDTGFGVADRYIDVPNNRYIGFSFICVE